MCVCVCVCERERERERERESNSTGLVQLVKPDVSRIHAVNLKQSLDLWRRRWPLRHRVSGTSETDLGAERAGGLCEHEHVRRAHLLLYLRAQVGGHGALALRPVRLFASLLPRSLRLVSSTPSLFSRVAHPTNSVYLRILLNDSGYVYVYTRKLREYGVRVPAACIQLAMGD